ncbi:Lsr2 family protein [Gordonia sp. L191]|uniref:histone-like nucleoid-structuring protein Lsr2 n=1 Tax=Gordonia sp. L191 TaxID=2982699 RepID=UPI0024C0A8CF|nr:Lsr2 family protein [Gordonia sp. L191]WHU49340.1 Lsr2 family protein [Gordonia sp. L191]
MARKEVVSFVDDLDGTELDVEDTHTVDWSWLGVDYRLDVSSENLDKIENGKVPLARLLTASTRVGGRRQSTAPKATTGGSQRPSRSRDRSTDGAAVREWAAGNGYDIAPRGRIPGAVLEAYHEAH